MLLRPVISTGLGLPMAWEDSASLQGADQQAGGQVHVPLSTRHSSWPGYTPPQPPGSDPLKEAP